MLSWNVYAVICTTASSPQSCLDIRDRPVQFEFWIVYCRLSITNFKEICDKPVGNVFVLFIRFLLDLLLRGMMSCSRDTLSMYLYYIVKCKLNANHARVQ